MELFLREQLTNNCFRRCMLTFLTYYSVGIHPRLDPRIGRGVPNEELSGIHSSSVLNILRERLGLRKICARWVPHLLTDGQKQSRVRLASQVIEKYDKCDPRRLEEIVTEDDTWIYHFQPDSKAKNKVWVSSEGDRPVIAHRCKTSNRMLYAVFFDSKGPVLHIPVPKGSSVTGKL